MNDSKIPALAQYGLYLKSTQKQTNHTGFKQRKEACHIYLKSLTKEALFYDDALLGQE